jgi:hypothetical protein
VAPFSFAERVVAAGTIPSTTLVTGAPAVNEGDGLIPAPPGGVPPTEAEIIRQMSYSGTPRGPDGTTMPDEYQRDLSEPIRRIQIFEEMRSSDDAVATAIDARRQEINAANWMLSTEDKTPGGTEILEFCEDNIYPLIDAALRWLGGGALQYGFGCLEPVYAWADSAPRGTILRGKLRRASKSARRGLYLTKFAHLRQHSIQTFRVNETGDLDKVVQWVYTGTSLKQNEIAGSKLLLWTYDQQGDDRWGVPPARHCYKAWTFKQQIEKLNLLHIDRFGVGMPVVEEGEGWGAPERARMAAFLKGWRSGGGNFIMHPSGGAVTVVSDDGKTAMSMLEWVRYYNLQIAKTYLTQGTELGSTETGARALGETFMQQMGGLVQADVEDLASVLNERLVKFLVDLNFGVQKVYPMFAPTQRVTLQGGVGTMLQQLITAGAIHPRPEDEAFLRDAAGLPAVDLTVLAREADERKVAAQAAADAAKAAAAAGGQQGDNAPPANDRSTPPARPKAASVARMRELGALQLAEGAPEPAVPYVSTYRNRDFTAWEHGILRPEVLGRDLDLQTSRLTSEVTDVLREIDAALAEQAAAHAADSAEVLAAAVRTIAVPEALRTKLRDVMMAAALRARVYGAEAVRAEVERQVAPNGIGPNRDGGYYPMPTDVTPDYTWYNRGRSDGLRQLVAGYVDDTATSTDEQRARDIRLAAQVDGAVENEIDRREQSVRSAMLTALTQAATSAASVLASVVAAAAKSALLGLSTARTNEQVQSVVNVGFGVGRSDMADQLTGPPGEGGGTAVVGQDGEPVSLVAKVYSAVMDFASCEECARWDGAQFPIDYPEDMTGVQCPNPRCYGTEKRCRCVWVYVTNLEEAPLVPASKGPIPFTAMPYNEPSRARAHEPREPAPAPTPAPAAFDMAGLMAAVGSAVEHVVQREMSSWVRSQAPAPAPAAPAPAAPQHLTIHVDAGRGPVRKTIVGPGGATYEVTEEQVPPTEPGA